MPLTSDARSRARASSPTRLGQYVMFDEFARGGMARVHLGRRVGAGGFSRLVAIKQLQPLLAESDAHQEGLLDEARLSARIHHPNVVQTLDTVVVDGVLHIVMEYVHGVSLARLLGASAERGGRVPLAVAIGIVVDALQGLHAAHEAKDALGAPLGIVHRDVSPHNVQVGADGVARLLDFGIAKALGRASVTATGEVKGKLAYMPREQLSGAPVTRQADLYAVGVVLWEALTGQRWLEETEAARLALRVLTETVPAPSTLVPGLPRALDEVVLRATSHDTRRRFATADELAANLLAAADRADATTIAAWVEDVAGDELELRAEHVQRIEAVALDEAPGAPQMRSRASLVSSSSSSSTASATAAGAPLAGLAQYAMAAMGGRLAEKLGLFGASRRRRAALALGLALGLATLVSGAVLATRRPEVLPPASRSAIAPELESSAPVLELDDVPADDEPAPVLTVRGVDDDTHKSPPASRASRAKRRAPGAASPAPSCDPPYSIESNGRKHYDPRCLR